MKRTISKRTSIDCWDSVKNKFSAQLVKATDSMITEAPIPRYHVTICRVSRKGNKNHSDNGLEPRFKGWNIMDTSSRQIANSRPFLSYQSAENECGRLNRI